MVIIIIIVSRARKSRKRAQKWKEKKDDYFYTGVKKEVTGVVWGKC